MPNIDKVIISPVKFETMGRNPLYSQVQAALANVIEEHFKNGDPFYSVRYLADSLSVSPITIRRALHELEAEGFLEKSQGKVPVVRKKSASSLVRTARTSTAMESAIGSLNVTKTNGLTAIGVFRPERLHIKSEYSMEMLDQLHVECERRGLEMLTYDTSSIDKLGRAFGSIHRSPDEVAFLLFSNATTTPLLYHALKDKGFRTVSMEGAPDDFDGFVVETDARMAAQIGLAHLRELGHSRIALLVNEPSAERSVQEKIQVFNDFVRLEGIEQSCKIVDCSADQGDSYTKAYQSAPYVFDSGKSTAPTAVFSMSDPGAWAIIKWCLQNGLSVPGDVSVLGFEDARSSRYMHPALTTVGHQVPLLADTVAEILCEKTQLGVKRVKIAPVLVLRESTAPFAAS